MNTPSKLAFVLLLATGCVGSSPSSENSTPRPAEGASFEVLSVSDVEWEQLNPARGDKSPQAGTLWGDRKGEVATGFLAKFVDGFSSPPHIHNATYRAVVLRGRIHNDDPDAAKMWMPAGSFWTQPKGEVHITAAKGATNVALVEIDQGPYLVLPTEEAFDSGERPVNMDASNVVWVDLPGSDAADNGPRIAYLWGSPQDGQTGGTFLKLPAGFTGSVISGGSTLRAVVIEGELEYRTLSDTKNLEPGSLFSSEGEWAHSVSASAGSECVLYVRSERGYDVVAESK